MYICIVEFNSIAFYSSDDDNRIILIPNRKLDMCQREYINASYIDVSLILY